MKIKRGAVAMATAVQNKASMELEPLLYVVSALFVVSYNKYLERKFVDVFSLNHGF